ncbi:conserved hypothetical protein [Gammaproteobacteria bacterium]
MKGGGGWGCPHEVDGACQRVEGRSCDPGMKGCVLFGRFVFSDPAKNRPHKTSQPLNQTQVEYTPTDPKQMDS